MDDLALMEDQREKAGWKPGFKPLVLGTTLSDRVGKDASIRKCGSVEEGPSCGHGGGTGC